MIVLFKRTFSLFQALKSWLDIYLTTTQRVHNRTMSMTLFSASTNTILRLSSPISPFLPAFFLNSCVACSHFYPITLPTQYSKNQCKKNLKLNAISCEWESPIPQKISEFCRRKKTLYRTLYKNTGEKVSFSNTWPLSTSTGTQTR